MESILIFFAVLFIIALVLALYFGVSAFFSWLICLAWNAFFVPAFPPLPFWGVTIILFIVEVFISIINYRKSKGIDYVSFCD